MGWVCVGLGQVVRTSPPKKAKLENNKIEFVICLLKTFRGEQRSRVEEEGWEAGI